MQVSIVGCVYNDMQPAQIGTVELRKDGLFITTDCDFSPCSGKLYRDCLGYAAVGATGKDLLYLKALSGGEGLIETPDGGARCLVHREVWQQIEELCENFLPALS